MKSPRRGQLAPALIPECPLRTLTLPAPVPAARARSNGARRFHPEDSAIARWREEAAIAIRRQWMAALLVGPVELKAVFILARPDSRPTWCPKDVWASGARFRHAPGCGPDVDNFLKAVMDALQMPRELRKVAGAGSGWPLRDDGAVAVSAQEKWIASSAEAARTVVGIRSVGWTEVFLGR